MGIPVKVVIKAFNVLLGNRLALGPEACLKIGRALRVLQLQRYMSGVVAIQFAPSKAKAIAGFCGGCVLVQNSVLEQ